MGRSLNFDVIGTPVPSPRPRATTVGKHARIYMPSTADDWKHSVRAAALTKIREGEPWRLTPPGVGVRVDLVFKFARPKSHLRTGRYSGMLKPNAPELHTQKPDKDNLEKAVLDALGEFDGMPPLIWCDDAQVFEGLTRKRWVRPGERPGVAVHINEVSTC